MLADSRTKKVGLLLLLMMVLTMFSALPAMAAGCPSSFQCYLPGQCGSYTTGTGCTTPGQCTSISGQSQVMPSSIMKWLQTPKTNRASGSCPLGGTQMFLMLPGQGGGFTGGSCPLSSGGMFQMGSCY